MSEEEEYAAYLLELISDGVEEGREHFRSLLAMVSLPVRDLERASLRTWQDLAVDTPDELVEALRRAGHG